MTDAPPLPRLRATLDALDDTIVRCGRCSKSIAGVDSNDEAFEGLPGSVSRNSPNGEQWRSLRLYPECKRDPDGTAKWRARYYRSTRRGIHALKRGTQPTPRRRYHTRAGGVIEPREGVPGYPVIVECWKCSAPNVIDAGRLRLNAAGVRIRPRDFHASTSTL